MNFLFHQINPKLGLAFFIRMVMAVFVRMVCKKLLLRLICVTYLLSITRQQDDPCSGSADGFGVCGLNGICRVVNTNSYNCSCPPGFDYVEKNNPLKGCLQNTSPQDDCSTNGATMERIERIDWSGNDYLHMESTNQTGCKQACIEDCYCTVAIYANVSGKENCWKKAMPLRHGKASDTRIAFVKVYNGRVSGDVPAPPSKVVKKEKGKRLAVVGITLTVSSLVFALILLWLWFFTCKPRLKSFQEQHKINAMGLSAFSYQDLDRATEGFAVEIGRGAFGTVYKGSLPDGRTIAVKKLNDFFKKENPNEREREFRTEIGIIAASHH